MLWLSYSVDCRRQFERARLRERASSCDKLSLRPTEWVCCFNQQNSHAESYTRAERAAARRLLRAQGEYLWRGEGGTREGNIFPLTPPQLVSGHRDMYVCTYVCNKQTHTHKHTLYVRQGNFPMYATFISNMELKNHKRNVSQKKKECICLQIASLANPTSSFWGARLPPQISLAILTSVITISLLSA